METCKAHYGGGQKFKPRTRGKDQGFALVSMLALVPLLFTVLGVLATTFFALKKKSLAQALCVQNGMQLQLALKVPLTKLLQLNPKAAHLRAAKVKVDRALKVAVATADPPAIAAAKAAQKAVLLEQLALQTTQRLLLGEAKALRFASAREMESKVRLLAASPVHSQSYFARALAVEPKPFASLTPNYEPVKMFSASQQEKFSFDVNVLGAMPFSENIGGRQKSECAVSLKESEGKWKIQIVAAKAPLKL